jgi:hypothetical protein
VERAHAALHIYSSHAIAEGIGVVALEVVTHFCFELNVGMDVECCSSAEPDVVGGRTGITKAEIFGEDSDFDVTSISVFCAAAAIIGAAKRSAVTMIPT